MIKSITGIFLMIVFVITGIFGADFLRDYQTQKGTYPDFIPWVDTTVNQAEEVAAVNPLDPIQAQPIDELTENFYLNFEKQFVVPVIEESKVDALIVVSLAIEVDREKEAVAVAIEPKLRDALTRALLGLANEGVFSGNITQADNLKKVQKNLNKAAKNIMGKSMKNVLILDVARQDR